MFQQKFDAEKQRHQMELEEAKRDIKELEEQLSDAHMAFQNLGKKEGNDVGHGADNHDGVRMSMISENEVAGLENIFQDEDNEEEDLPENAQQKVQALQV